MRTSSRRVRSVGILVLLCACCMPRLDAADGEACDPPARAANLRFTLKNMDGKDVTLSAHKGKVILLNFWATWCAPCKIEIPGLVELFNKYEREGLVVLGVSVDDPVSKLRPFAEQFKMNYPILVGNGREDLLTSFAPLHGVPRSFLIARDGTICKRHTGIAPKEVFEREIKSLL